MKKLYKWQRLSGTGLEHLSLTESVTGVMAESVVVSDQFACSYLVDLTSDWYFRKARVKCPDGQSLDIEAEQTGQWKVNGRVMDELEDAVDIDFTFSPFTNTLPIRRLRLDVSESADIMAAYIDAPSLEVFVDPQRYTRTSPNTYLFESLDSNFKAAIKVDTDGFVLDYPGLYRILA